MATIIKRKKAYSVVYNYTDENGKTKQKWETWYTQKEALRVHAKISDRKLSSTHPGNYPLSGLTGGLCRHAGSA